MQWIDNGYAEAGKEFLLFSLNQMIKSELSTASKIKDLLNKVYQININEIDEEEEGAFDVFEELDSAYYKIKEEF